MQSTPTEATCTMRDHHAQLGKRAADLYSVIAEVSGVSTNRKRLLISLLSDLHHFADQANLNWKELLKFAEDEYQSDVKKDDDFRRGANRMRMEC